MLCTGFNVQREIQILQGLYYLETILKALIVKWQYLISYPHFFLSYLKMLEVNESMNV